MRKLLALISLLAMLTACQESLEERAARETAEYNRKFCPQRVDASTTLDSIVFDKATLTKRSYFTLEGVADDLAAAQANAPRIREALIADTKNSPNEKKFKEAGFSSYFVYWSASHKGQVLYETTITEADYQ